MAVVMAKPCAAAQPAAGLPEQCGLNYSSLFAHFQRPMPDYAIVRFKDEKEAWVQWLDIDKGASDGSSGSVDTRFLGQQGSGDHRSAVKCSLEDASQKRNPWNFQNPTCPNVAFAIDSGPEAIVHEVYYDGSSLRIIFKVIERKWFAAGIARLDEQLALSIDGKVVRTIHVRGFEPQMILAELKLARGRHYAVVYGLLENVGSQKGQLRTTNGAVCV